MANLSNNAKDILNRSMKEMIRTYGYKPEFLDVEFGDFLHETYDSATGVTLPFAGDISLDKEVDHLLYVVASTTGNADGGDLAIRAGNAQGAGTDGVLSLGDANTSEVDLAATGIATIVKGTLQVDEAVTMNGAVTLGNAAADDVTFSGVVAGNVTFKKESGHTVAVAATTTSATAGGALALAAAAGVTTGAGGAASLTAGAGGNDAVGGAASLVAGAAGGGNRAGGAVAVTGGAGAGSAAGGAIAATGGAGGATGAGGAIAVAGGAGGATSGTGGAITIVGGAGTNGNANGGAVSIDGGAKNGSGTDGAINIGATSGAYVNFGKKVRAAAAAWSIADPGDAGAIPVTDSGVCNLTTGGAGETRTVAIPTFVGQELTICLDTDGGGDAAVTFASDFDQSGNNVWTAGDAGDTLVVIGCTIGGTRAWRLVANLGGAVS